MTLPRRVIPHFLFSLFIPKCWLTSKCCPVLPTALGTYFFQHSQRHKLLDAQRNRLLEMSFVGGLERCFLRQDAQVSFDASITVELFCYRIAPLMPLCPGSLALTRAGVKPSLVNMVRGCFCRHLPPAAVFPAVGNAAAF